MTNVQLLRRQSLWLSRLTLFLFSATALIIVVPTIYGLFHLEENGFQLAPVLIRAAVIWSPSIFYLYALWAVRSAFRDFATGGVFGPAIARGCTRAGVALAIGATLSAVGVPNLMRILHAQNLVERSPSEFTGVLIFDTAYLAVGVVGLALVLLGGLLRRAVEIQGEAAAMRSELDEFF
ncbi:MAG TPA: DUF2975 domain-containing protein [Allosphingosinicella sp.]|jgi:hypothetical protein